MPHYPYAYYKYHSIMFRSLCLECMCIVDAMTCVRGLLKKFCKCLASIRYKRLILAKFVMFE